MRSGSPMHDQITNLLFENEQLREEVNYYRMLLFADMTPKSASIINALRKAVDVVEENERLRSGAELQRVSALCRELEKENRCLKESWGNR